MFTQRQREAPGLRLRMQTFITTTALCACAALSGCSGEATPALASRRAAVSYLEQAVLNDPMGNEIATNDDAMGRGLCSEINPMTDGAARLPAGTYSVCVSAFEGMAGPVAIPNYYLTIRINAP